MSAGSGLAGWAVINGRFSALLAHVLSTAYAHPRSDVLGDETFKQLVMARVLEPTSMADSIHVLDEFGVAHGSPRTIFRPLDRARERKLSPPDHTDWPTH